jgi:hypothetical protein
MASLPPHLFHPVEVTAVSASGNNVENDDS